ncbi:MAG: hypothetical protein HYS73_00985 [Parcubacteria group bacterium]|nr:hypothetical protein [Parcubacteria group bacterium]
MALEPFPINNYSLRRKIVAATLVCAVLLGTAGVFPAPKTAQAVLGVGDVVFDPGNFVPNSITAEAASAVAVKDTFLDAIAWGITKLAINRLTLSMVEWIRTGYKGGPSFLSNPEFFYRDLANEATGVFINELGLNEVLCEPWEFGVKFALSFQKPYALKAECTLLESLTNFEQMSENFLAGGWKSFMNISLNQQNNPYGAFMQAQSELAFRAGQERERQKDDLTFGRGFFSITSEGECLQYDPTSLESCVRRAPNRVVTPGSYVADIAGGVGLSPLRQAELADEINESLGIIAGEMILQALSQNKGLLNASTAPIEEQEFALSGGVSNSLGSLLSIKIDNLARFQTAKSASLLVIQNTYPVYDTLLGIRDASLATGYDDLGGVVAYVVDQQPGSCLAQLVSQGDASSATTARADISRHISALANANAIEESIPLDISRARGFQTILADWLEEINSGSASTARLEDITEGFNSMTISGLDFSSPVTGFDTPAENENQALEDAKDDAEDTRRNCPTL